MILGLLALYGGPDQVMTVTSGIASVIGVLLVFWHKVVGIFVKLFGRSPDAPSKPQSSPEKSS
jgi:hypothetical protein